jgi:hypothetical protein
MRINFNYTSIKHYDRTNIMQWVWMFKKYTFFRGFIMRIFGVYINVRGENMKKLIKEAVREVIQKHY